MAEKSSRQRQGELLAGVLRILLDHPEGLPAKDVLARLEVVVPPTDFERQDYPKRPGVRRFEKTVRFATINLVKAGWLVKSKGRWTATEQGRRAYEQLKNPDDLAKKAWELFQKWRASQPETPEEEAESTATLEEAEEAAWSEIESYLKQMSPYDFQNLVAGLLRAMGYHVSWVAPPGPDKGLDILAHIDPLGTSVPRIKVQVKRREDKISVDGLRTFMAVLGDHDVGIFVSMGGFTNDAEMEARTQEKRKVTLIDLERLFDLWVQHYDKIAESEKRLLPLKPVYYLAPSE